MRFEDNTDISTQFRLQKRQFEALGIQIWDAINRGIAAGLQQAGIPDRFQEEVEREILAELQSAG